MSSTTRLASTSDLPFLGEVDGLPVGFLRWGLFWDQVPFMNLLWVLPDWRGQGIGTALVDAWEKSQRVAGHSMVLTSTVSAETAQHLYRRLGYVDSGALLLPDEPAELLLRKPLA
jgi:ribosomal protein S18 acetylase RimI-like enzyme